jgi:hypothetical protein
VARMTDKYYILREGDITRGIPLGVASGRELSIDDARLLRVRYVLLKVRNMDEEAAWILEVMQALGIAPTRVWAPVQRRVH